MVATRLPRKIRPRCKCYLLSHRCARRRARLGSCTRRCRHLSRNVHPPTPAAATVGVPGERDRWEVSFWQSLDVRYSLMPCSSSHSCGYTSLPPTQFYEKMCPKWHPYYVNEALLTGDCHQTT